MAHRLNITLDDDSFGYLNRRDNRSAFIQQLIQEHKRRELEQEIIRAMEELDNNPEYIAGFHEWDVTLADGLDEEENEDEFPAAANPTV